MLLEDILGIQCTDTILMIRPSGFRFNPETSTSNSFQKKPSDSWKNKIHENALLEFDSVVQRLINERIKVIVYEEQSSDSLPDSIFPNNWISFHPNRKIILYPLQSELRRKERRNEVLDLVTQRLGITNWDVLDLSSNENKSMYLEGTGSMVLDRVHKIVYAADSIRTNKEILAQWASEMGYKIVSFSTNFNGLPVYHTNVMLTIGVNFAVVCTDIIPDIPERNTLIRSLESSGHRIINIDIKQMSNFAGNMLQVQNSSQESLLLLSDGAAKSLQQEQLSSLSGFTKLVDVAIPTIEDVGGGSIRCMIAEVFY